MLLTDMAIRLSQRMESGAMRRTRIAAAAGLLLCLAGCALSPDPAQGELFSGIKGLASGGYQQRVDQQQAQLDEMRRQQAEAEAEAAQAEAALADRQRALQRLRDDVATLDLSLRDARAKAARLREGNSALSVADDRLNSDLEHSTLRLAELQEHLKSGRADADYEAERRQYQSLEAAIAAISKQLEGAQRQQ
jgi:chromosome segregation ATPase